MAPGAPRSKRKVARGGGKKFSRDLIPHDGEGEPEGMWGEPRDSKPEVAGSSEEESDSDGGSKQELTREERRAQAKARKEAAKAAAAAANKGSDDEEEESEDEVKPKARGDKFAAGNPNASTGAEGNMSRKEREAIEKAEAQKRFWKLQEAGKTDQAKADLARLAEIRAKREAAAEQRKAEAREKKELAESRRK
ncbi:hypothetical protein RUND412_001193 [Rhizina undulata]